MIAFLCAAVAAARAASSGAVGFSNSIREVATDAAAAARLPHHARVARAVLRADEAGATMTVEVALRMRNFTEFQSRAAQGGRISEAEKQAGYYPTRRDHDAVVKWLRSQGLTIRRTDDNRLAIFASGSVAAVARAFNVSFARVATDEGEFTSAVTAPSLPPEIAPVVLGIHGLQPHIRRHVLGLPRSLQPNLTGSTPYFPAQIAHTYNADTLSATGSGQTIAIYAFAQPQPSDLVDFWTAAGISQSLSNIQMVSVAGGPAPSPTSGYLEEVSLDAEWASSMAPGATVRIYAANENDAGANDEILQQVYADLPTQPNLHILSICIGGNELEVEHDYLIMEAQFMANLASAGVTVLSASGDNGAYANNVLQTTYPTSDPSVTGVGGTSLVLDQNGNLASESAWSQGGGGVSAVFSRPSWQSGPGVPAGTMRLVPDVSAAANPNEGALLVYQGSQIMIGGTSWAAPTWAGFCALINQTRANAGQPPVGLLNSTIYPLIGTASFRDITTGNNGYYVAGAGYDLCTGIGVPNVAVLSLAALSPGRAPAVVAQLGNRTTVAGQPVVFSVAAFGAAPLSYQWQRLPAGQGTWVNLTDAGAYSGSSTETLVVTGTTLSMNGDAFRCVVGNAAGAPATSGAAALAVNSTGVTTMAGWPGAAGSSDGTGWRAGFNFPGGVKVNAAGSLVIADSSNDTVRLVTQSGVVTTLAGTAGKTGSTDGGPGVALFNGIGGVAPDSHGNIYVADSLNYTIRMIAANGNVSTIAGQPGTKAHLDGSGSGATFSDPENLAINPVTGNIFVADGQGNTIRMVTPQGVVTTFAGTGGVGSANGPGASASFRDPSGIAVDSAGNVYVADTGNDVIRKITPAGVVSTVTGRVLSPGNTDGALGSARFSTPAGIAVDAFGNIYVADSGNDTIREISPTGTVTTIAGAAGVPENIDGLPLSARFWTPGDIAVDSSGTLYVADTYNFTVRRLVISSVSAPSITTSPLTQAVVAGGTLTLTVSASGTAPLSYQWYDNGVAIAGATGASLSVAAIGTTQAGNYSVIVSNTAGTVTSADATVSVSQSARLTNISARAFVGTGGGILISGFGSSGSGSKNLLLRGVGPGLTAYFGLPGTMANPQLELFDNGQQPGEANVARVIATDTGWGNPIATGSSPVAVSPQAATTALMNALGAFTIVPGSADSAMEVTAAAGSYTAQVSGVGGATGIALAEIYDADTGSPPAQLVNISARADVGVGGNILIGGFAIAGTTSETLLIRGVGPGLGSYFGFTGYLAIPQLVLVDGLGNQNVIASISGWDGNPVAGNSTVSAGLQPATAAIMSTVGAFPLVSGSTDAAMVVTLPQGSYTVQLSGSGGSSGVGLVEIYAVP